MDSSDPCRGRPSRWPTVGRRRRGCERRRFRRPGRSDVRVHRVAACRHYCRQPLKAVIDVAIAGDDQPIPVLQRGWVSAAEATTEVTDFLAVVGQVLRDAAERVAGLLLVADEAAANDADIEALTRQRDTQRASTVAWIVDGIIDRSPLRAGISRDHAVDTSGC